MHDYRHADLTPRERALCDFAVKLTHLAAEIDAADIAALRAHDLDDVAISDAIQVVSYFNYITRVADGVGIEDEPDWSQAGGPTHPTSEVGQAERASDSPRLG